MSCVFLSFLESSCVIATGRITLILRYSLVSFVSAPPVDLAPLHLSPGFLPDQYPHSHIEIPPSLQCAQCTTTTRASPRARVCLHTPCDVFLSCAASQAWYCGPHVPAKLRPHVLGLATRPLVTSQTAERTCHPPSPILAATRTLCGSTLVQTQVLVD